MIDIKSAQFTPRATWPGSESGVFWLVGLKSEFDKLSLKSIN